MPPATTVETRPTIIVIAEAWLSIQPIRVICRIFDNKEEDYNREIVKSVYISFLKKLIDYLDYIKDYN
jgi:hypothetical protein